MNPRTNKSIIIQLKKGNILAFTKLYSLYNIKLFNYALKHLKTREDAEEVVQDTFVKLWQYKENIDEKLSFDGFIFKITKNIILNRIRKRYVEFQLLPENHEIFLTDNGTEDLIKLHDLENLAQIAIKDLPPKRKLIFELSRVQGLTNSEIAKKLKLSPKTVEAQLTKALRSIRDFLHLNTDFISVYLLLILFF